MITNIARQLRDAAEGDTPEPHPHFGLNIGSWLGCRNPAWDAVFQYSTGMPFFCWLDADSQRTALLIIAHDLSDSIMRSRPTQKSQKDHAQ